MPNLNIKDEPKRNFKRQPLSPFKRAPLTGGGSKTLHVMITLGIIVLVAVGVYLANEYGYIQLWTKKVPMPAVVPQQQETQMIASADTVAVAPTVPAPTATEPKKKAVEKKAEIKPEKKPEVKADKKPEVKVEKKPEAKPEKKPEVKPITKQTVKTPESEVGEFSIIIGSFRNKSIAEAEANKWKDVGYVSAVSEKSNWYRLALGKYATKKEALEDAKKLADGFEGGYWIEKVK